jgi:hypothetical protein
MDQEENLFFSDLKESKNLNNRRAYSFQISLKKLNDLLF